MRRFMLIGIAALALAVGFGGSSVRAEHSDAADVDAAFKQAFMAGDLDALDALGAPGLVEVNPFGVFRGTAEAHAFAVQFVTNNPGLSVSFSESAVVLNTAVHRIFIASDPIRSAGVSRIVLIHTLVIAQGKIITLTATLDLSDPETATYASATAR